jgi:hypothetical protein
MSLMSSYTSLASKPVDENLSKEGKNILNFILEA